MSIVSTMYTDYDIEEDFENIWPLASLFQIPVSFHGRNIVKVDPTESTLANDVDVFLNKKLSDLFNSIVSILENETLVITIPERNFLVMMQFKLQEQSIITQMVRTFSKADDELKEERRHEDRIQNEKFAEKKAEERRAEFKYFSDKTVILYKRLVAYLFKCAPIREIPK